MLNLIPLPVVWLLFFLAGRALSRGSLTARRIGFAACSCVVLLCFCGARTFGFYLLTCCLFLAMGRLLNAISRPSLRTCWFVLSLATAALMILVFLKFRIYVQKYFVHLPSLSYLGFRVIAYLVSEYRRRDVPFSAGMMQMVFMPMLVMGPIARVENFEEENFDYQDAFRRLVLGLSMLIAGRFFGFYVPGVSEIASSGMHCWEYWLGAAANSFNIYFLFAGYSHLIIGLGLLAGFRLPENFNNPYAATSVGDFWRRWHMSLSFWIRDYLYIPLGGNRKGIVRKCFNLMLPMAICGIWHGLTTNYLVWGLYHGFLLCVESVLNHFEIAPLQRLGPRFYKPAKIGLTFGLVTFGWILFVYPTPTIGLYLRGMFAWPL